MIKKNFSVLLVMVLIPMLFYIPAHAAFYNIVAEYDHLSENIRNNCVMFARYKVPSLPYGLTSYQSKKNICNSNIAIAGEIAIMPSNNAPQYGHVAYVESVNGSNITIIEGGVINKYDRRYHINRRSGSASELQIYGYYNPGGLINSDSSIADSSSATWNGIVTGTGGQTLAINSIPKAGNQIGEIPEGAVCTVYPDKTSGNWYWVSYNGVSGYSYKSYIAQYSAPSSSNESNPVSPSNNTWNGIVTGTGGQTLAINSIPKSGNQIGEIPEGAVCTVYPDKTSGNWYWVSYNGVSGYSYKSYIIQSSGGTSSNTRTGIVTGTGGQTLAINSIPKAGNQIGEIPEGAVCTVYPDKTSGNWYWVSYNGVSGYSYKLYITLN